MCTEANKSIHALFPVSDEERERINRTCWWAPVNLAAGDAGYEKYIQQTFNVTNPAELCEEDREKANALWETFLLLQEKLLDVGGEMVVFNGDDPFAGDILERGRAWIGQASKMLGSWDCYRSIAPMAHTIWLNNRRTRDVSLCHGYALATNGLWYAATWVLWKHKVNGKPIVTLVDPGFTRLAYFGFASTDEEAEHFCEHWYDQKKVRA